MRTLVWNNWWWELPWFVVFGPDLIIGALIYVAGALIGWWGFANVPIEGGIFIVLVLILFRLAWFGVVADMANRYLCSKLWPHLNPKD